MNIESYDWDNLYNKAEEFIHQYIPEAVVCKGIKTFSSGKPKVDVSFPEKGHKADIEILCKTGCFRSLRGANIGGSRISKGEIIFNSDGTLGK